MQNHTEIASFRKELGMTLEQFAVAVGISSKGRASEMERSGKCSLPVALAIERLSQGRINAAALNADIAAARRGIDA